MSFLRFYKKKSVVRNLSRFAPRSIFLFIFVSHFSIISFAQENKSKRVTILPLITFFNTTGEPEVYNWWSENESTGLIKKISEKFYKTLEKQANLQWQYLNTKEMIRVEEFAKTNLTDNEMIQFAQKKQAALVLVGDCKINKSPILDQGYRVIVQWKVMRVKNQEKAAEVLRIFDLQSYEFEHLMLDGVEPEKPIFLTAINDVHDQLESFKKRDKFQMQKLDFIVSGQLKQNQLNSLLSKIQQAIPAVKSISQRSIENEQVNFSLNYSGTSSFGQSLSQLSLKDFMTQVVSDDGQLVVYDVKVRERK